VGLADPLRAVLAPLAARIGAAFVYGSVANRQDTASSDIDVLIVSNDLSYGELVLALDALSQRLGRTVNPTIYTPKELAQRVKQGDAFVKRVLAQQKIWLIGDEHALGV
jgi:predicted nucleotidyltransferase